MIERRCMLSGPLKFQGGRSLPGGTIVYVEETEGGWVGKHYPSETSSGGSVFMLEAEDFTILQDGDIGIENLIVVSPSPEPTKSELENRALARKRIARKIEAHRKEADYLEKALEEGVL